MNRRILNIVPYVMTLVLLISCSEIDNTLDTVEDTVLTVSNLLLSKNDNSNELTISWTPPTDTSEVSYYLVEIEPEGESPPIKRRIEVKDVGSLVDGTQTEIVGVPTGKYSVKIAVVRNDREDAKVSSKNEVEITTSATAPTSTPISTSSGTNIEYTSSSEASVTFTLTKPTATGYTHGGQVASITSYALYFYKSENGVASTVQYDKKEVLEGPFIFPVTATIEELEPATSYSVLALSTNDAGLQSDGTSTAITTKAASNAERPVFEGEIVYSRYGTSDFSITLSWTRPRSFGKKNDGSSADFEAYYIYWTEGAILRIEGEPQKRIETMASSLTQSITLTNDQDGVLGNTKYSFAIVAVNNNSENSVYSKSKGMFISFTTEDRSTTPSDVSFIEKDTAYLEDQALKITWNYDGVSKEIVKNEEGKDAAVEYYVYRTIAGTYINAEAIMAAVEPQVTSDYWYIFTNLDMHASYDIVVVAVNSAVPEQKGEAKHVTLTSNGIRDSINSEQLQYGGIEINASTGKEYLYSIDRDTTTIPDTAKLNYSFIITPVTKEISVSAIDGNITVTSSAPEARYTMTVTATVDESDPRFTGHVDEQLTIIVGTSKVTYKPDFPSFQDRFSIGDIDNPLLFQINGTTDTSGITARLTITNEHGDDVYDRFNRPVCQELELHILTFQDSGGVSIVGAGPQSEDILFDFVVQKQKVTLEIEITEESGGYAKETMLVDVSDSGAIFTWKDLQNISKAESTVSSIRNTYTLKNDIVFPTVGTYGFSKFTPLGNTDKPFRGVFEGSNYTISGIYINEPTKDMVGIFGRVISATIRDLQVRHIGITGKDNVGGLAGYIAYSKLENIGVENSNNSQVSGKNNVGGLVGAMFDTSEDESRMIIKGYAEGVVSGENGVGGLIGYWFGLGHIVGYVTGVVKGTSKVGGLVGLKESGNSVLVGYAIGEVKGKDHVGGLVGFGGGTVTGYTRATITFTGTSEDEETIGLLLGRGSGVGYYSATESNITPPNNDGVYSWQVNGQKMPMRSSTTENDFSLFSFDDGTWIWEQDGAWPAIDIGVIKPASDQPIQQTDYAPESCIVMDNKPTYNIPDEVYEIDSWQKLQWIQNCLTASFRLTKDITLPSPGNDGLPADGFASLGNYLEMFSGHLDGGGYTIDGLKISLNSKNNVGLFSFTAGATIENLIIDHDGISGGENVGALIGFARDTVIENVGMESSTNEKVSGTQNIGGLVGQVHTDRIKLEGYTTGNVSGESGVGGLVGSILIGNDVVVTGYTTGDITGTGESVGGLVGYMVGGELKGYSKGAISGGLNVVGGLVGHMAGGTIIGYSRSIITRGSGEKKSFGLIVGYVYQVAITAYHSKGESRFIGIDVANATGDNGTEIDITTVTSTDHESTFSGFVFDTSTWEWIEDGKWPAINIGTIKAGAEQPIAP